MTKSFAWLQVTNLHQRVEISSTVLYWKTRLKQQRQFSATFFIFSFSRSKKKKKKFILERWLKCFCRKKKKTFAFFKLPFMLLPRKKFSEITSWSSNLNNLLVITSYGVAKRKTTLLSAIKLVIFWWMKAENNSIFSLQKLAMRSIRSRRYRKRKHFHQPLLNFFFQFIFNK